MELGGEDNQVSSEFLDTLNKGGVERSNYVHYLFCTFRKQTLSNIDC